MTDAPPAHPARTYTGGCHCGAVRYEVTTPLDQLVSCNCSICSKRGWILTFAAPDQFRLLSGEGASTDYQFNKKRIHHLFCSTCGVSAYGWGTNPKGEKSMSINVRCLEGVDVTALKVHHYNGKDH